MLNHRRLFFLALAAPFLLFSAANAAEKKTSGPALPPPTPIQPAPKKVVQAIEITKGDAKVTVKLDGVLLTEYYYKDVPRPYFYPVVGPTGEPVNRHWPMAMGEGEQTDHVHHRSLWFTHGDVNGIDFWSESSKKMTLGQIVHQKFLKVESGDDVGVIATQNDWISEGKVICRDTRKHTFRRGPHGPMIDFEVVVHASEGDVTFRDTKEGSMAVRLAPTMRLRGDVGQGHIINSEGVKDKDTWGKKAAWVDYVGPVKGETVGVAIFDHPDNARHPTWWHVRDYGLFAANPFGVHYFEKKEANAGDMKIAKGQEQAFRYRLYIHRYDTKQAEVAKMFKEYAAMKPRLTNDD